jgi:hypothetical protein
MIVIVELNALDLNDYGKAWIRLWHKRSFYLLLNVPRIMDPMAITEIIRSRIIWG